MNRLLLTVSLLAAGALLLTGCASSDDQDTLSSRQDPAAEGAPPVPGAEQPAPNAHSGGWW